MARLLWVLATSTMVAGLASVAHADALVVRWTMENENGHARDAGPHGLDAELKAGATLEAGPEGRHAARIGVGAGGHLQAPRSGEIDRVVSAVTLTSWIRLDARPADGAAVIATKRSGWWEPAPYVLMVTENGSLFFNGNDGTRWIEVRSPGDRIRAGQWHHVAFTFDVENGVNLYVDGQPSGSRASRGEPLQRNNHRLKLGHESGSQHVQRSQFKGMIGETRLYAARLTEEQIRQDMAGQVAATRVAEARTPEGTPAQMEEGRLVASIVFDRDPIERGLTFARNNIDPDTVTVGGEEVEAWKVKHGSSPGAGWLRSVYLTFTDERFRNGNMPAVDIELEYRHTASTGLDVVADTERGSRRVGGRWGGNPRFRTVRMTVDDAFFGAREHQGQGHGVDGYDLRINAANEDWHIRAIRVYGYDLSENPDFGRLVRIDSVEAPDRPIFLYKRGESGRLNYTLRNIAQVPFEGRYRLRLETHGGERVAEREDSLRIDAASKATVGFGFDTSDVRFGVYHTTFELLGAQAAGEKPLITRSGSIGVGSGTELRKAREGEYMYGLDPQLGSPHGSEAMRAWMRAMGVDIVRHGLDMNNRQGARQSIQTLHEDGLKVVAMLDVPKEENHAEFTRNVDRAARFAAEIGRELGIAWWELGNEPDLPFFFPAGIERYLEGYYPMYDAIKAATPNAIVMNGGLANASHLPVSMERTRQFIELVDPSRIDMLAYHAHGSGVRAERTSLQRIRELVRKHGKPGLAAVPLVDTETGVAARGRQQELMQAATAIQKIVYSQSQGQPWLLWFRLLFEQPEAYGNLYSRQEPRPSVMSYRAMVEALKGYRFEHLLDLGHVDLEGYVFHEIDGPGRRVVLWSNEPARRDVTVDLGPVAGVGGVELRDMFGNPQALAVQAGGVVEVTVTDQPGFVLWETGAPQHRVAVGQPVIEVLGGVELVAGSENPLVVRVRNPRDSAVTARLSLRAEGEVQMTAYPVEQQISLGAGEVGEVPVTLRVAERNDAIVWPTTWRLFAPLERMPDPGKVDSVPDSLGGVEGRAVFARDSSIDVARAVGRVRERLPAVLVAEVESAKTQRVTFGASADWWMAWYVNGEQVYSTLERGNGGGFRVTDHTFEVDLKQGTNLVVVQLLSGSHGWRLVTDSPRVVKQALAGTELLSRLEVEVTADGQTLGRATAGLSFADPLPRWAGDVWRASADRIEAMGPTATLGEPELTNLFVAHPDSSRWWGGQNDLSAQVWMGQDAHRLYMVVGVRDDVHRPASEIETMGDRDSIVVGVAGAGGESPVGVTIGLIDNRSRVAGDDRLAGATEAHVERDESAKTTWYRLSVSREALGDSGGRVNLLVNDSDGDEGRKQYLQWRGGLEDLLDARLWRRVVLR